MRIGRISLDLTLAFALTLVCGAATGRAADYFVPDTHPNLPAAIGAASVSPDVDNTIWITESPQVVSGTLYLDAAFNALRKLTIRPIGTLGRATIASNNGAARIVWLDAAGHVTLQDLDIVRNATNSEDLVYMNYQAGVYPHSITIQRCRIGSIWTATGAPDKACVRILQPVNVVVRNCITFAYLPGTLDRGMWAGDFSVPENSVLLYNNVVADHRLAGIRVDEGAGGAVGSLVVLRNNVVSNHPALDPEPYGYVSFVGDPVERVTSHNAVFATAGFGEFVGAGHLTIAGVGGGTLIGLPRAAADPSFIEQTWDLDPPWDPNSNFWRLLDGGPLHDAPADYGQTVGAGSPHARDVAVTDDIERQGRPGGVVPNQHTDRGADQIEPGAVLAVEPRPSTRPVLWAAPGRNPAPSVELRFRSESAGRLTFELFDVAGRLLHRAEQLVAGGAAGTLRWSGGSRGLMLYRLKLMPAAGATCEVTGRVAVLR